MSPSDRTESVQHSWVTVVNPSNHRMLLQACDNCGVVKSENSVMRRCRAAPGQAQLREILSLGLRATA